MLMLWMDGWMMCLHISAPAPFTMKCLMSKMPSFPSIVIMTGRAVMFPRVVTSDSAHAHMYNPKSPLVESQAASDSKVFRIYHPLFRAIPWSLKREYYDL